MVSFVVFASDLFRNFSWAVSCFRVESEMRGVTSLRWVFTGHIGSGWVSGIEMMPGWTVRVSERWGDAKLALNYWHWDSNEMSLADDITGCHVGHPPTRWLCLRRSCPQVWVGTRAGLDGRRAAKRNRCHHILFFRRRDKSLLLLYLRMIRQLRQ